MSKNEMITKCPCCSTELKVGGVILEEGEIYETFGGKITGKAHKRQDGLFEICVKDWPFIYSSNGITCRSNTSELSKFDIKRKI